MVTWPGQLTQHITSNQAICKAIFLAYLKAALFSGLPWLNIRLTLNIKI